MIEYKFYYIYNSYIYILITDIYILILPTMIAIVIRYDASEASENFVQTHVIHLQKFCRAIYLAISHNCAIKATLQQSHRRDQIVKSTVISFNEVKNVFVRIVTARKWNQTVSAQTSIRISK